MSALGAGAAAVVRDAVQAAASIVEPRKPSSAAGASQASSRSVGATQPSVSEPESEAPLGAAEAGTPPKPDGQRMFLEVHVERQRILAVLDQLVERLEVALCLPMLVKHAGNTKRNCFFSPAEMQLLLACREYSMASPQLDLDKAPGEVPPLGSALAGSLEKTREEVLRSTGRLKAVRRLERAVKKRQEEERRARSTEHSDNRDLYENNEDEEDESEVADGGDHGEGDEEEQGEGSSESGSDESESIFSVSSDHPYSIAGYSSSYFDEGKTSLPDKEHAAAIIKEMIRRREEKRAARQQAKEAEADGGDKGAQSGFWGPGSKLEERAAAKFSRRRQGRQRRRGDGDAGSGVAGGAAGAEAGAGPPVHGPLLGHSPARLDPRIARLIETLYARPLMRKAVREFLLPEVSDAAKVFLEYARGLRACAEQRLQRTPREEAAREEQLRRVFARNAEAALELQRLQEQLEETRAAGDQELTQRADDVDLYEKRIERLITKHKADMTKRENASERSMVMEWKSSQMRQMALEQELQDLEDHLKTLRENNHKAESDMRTRRTKLERQLEAIIASYDSDMSERQAELDQLTQELEDERRALAELQTQLREQEEDYEQLLAERSEEEEAHFQRQLWTFLTNRAARVIQRGWREHLVRKAARRKAKGKGKGKDKKKK